jgi:hypothetical protein
MEILGLNAFKDQETAMDKGMKFPGHKKLRDTIERYKTIKHEVSWKRRRVLHNERVEQENQENADTLNEIRIRQTWWRHSK